MLAPGRLISSHMMNVYPGNNQTQDSAQRKVRTTISRSRKEAIPLVILARQLSKKVFINNMFEDSSRAREMTRPKELANS
jgi:hypothetical protein